MSQWVILEFGNDGCMNACWGPVADVNSAIVQAKRLQDKLIQDGYNQYDQYTKILPIRPMKEMMK